MTIRHLLGRHRESTSAWQGVNGNSFRMPRGTRLCPGLPCPDPAANFVQACSDGAIAPIHGQILSREQALAHPWLPKLWEVVDFVLLNDPTVRSHLYRPLT